jgi:septum formation protein
VDESLLQQERPAEHVERLARAKAGHIAERERDALVVGGDTIVVHKDAIVGKPKDEGAAIDMLNDLSGSRHEVLSGIAVAGPHGIVSTVATATVRMRTYDRNTSAAYVATGEPMDKAGGYGIQGLGASLVESVDGDYYAVIGFPVASFVHLLEAIGFRYDFGVIQPKISD